MPLSEGACACASVFVCGGWRQHLISAALITWSHWEKAQVANATQSHLGEAIRGMRFFFTLYNAIESYIVGEWEFLCVCHVGSNYSYSPVVGSDIIQIRHYSTEVYECTSIFTRVIF